MFLDGRAWGGLGEFKGYNQGSVFVLHPTDLAPNM